MSDFDTGKALEKQVLMLFDLVQRMRTELAEIHQPEGDGQVLDSAADQLDAITHEAEDATHTILDATEKITAVNKILKSEIKYGGARPHFDELDEQTRRVLEACQMHDVVGQRLSRIVRTINLVEGTLNSLVVTMGDSGVTSVTGTLKEIDRKDGDLKLSGPQIKGEGMGQDDIDALFGQDKD